MLLPGRVECLMGALQLLYDAEKDEYSNRRGVELRPVDFGGIDGVYELDPMHSMITLPIFKPIVDSLRRDGYEVGKDLYGAPYDWRLAGDAHLKAQNGVGGFYPNITKLIEKTVAENDMPVVLVSHSLGSILVLHYLHGAVSETWRRRHIAGWYSVNGVFGGSSMVPVAYATGSKLGLPLVPNSYFKPMEVNAASGMLMMPQRMTYQDRVVIKTPSKNYKASDWVEMLKDLNNTMMLTISHKLNRIGISPERFLRFVPGVPTHFVVSKGLQTPLRYEFDTDLVDGFAEAPSNIEYVDGDGTVTWFSLISYRQWEGTDSSDWSEEVFSNVDHRDSITNLRVADSLRNFLKRLKKKPKSGTIYTK